MVGIIALVSNQTGTRRHGREQRGRSGYVGDLPASQEKGVRPALVIDERMDFGGTTAPRPTDRLSALPPFAPLAERCALTTEESIITIAGGSVLSPRAIKIFCHNPFLLQRLYRLKTVVYGPYSSGSARQRHPSRNRWIIPLMIRRSSWRTGPVWTCGKHGSITAHCASLSQKLSAMSQALLESLNHNSLIEYRP